MAETTTRGDARNTLARAAKLLAVVISAYLVLAAVVFDFTKPAYSDDEDNYNGREVAFGPRPRSLFQSTRSAARGGFAGDEWYWVAFRPICAIWRAAKGYAPPAELR